MHDTTAFTSELEVNIAADLRAPGTLRERLRLLWRYGVAVRGKLADDAVRRLLLHAAFQSGLATDLARFHKRERSAREDLEHVVAWALAGRDPFGGEA